MRLIDADALLKASRIGKVLYFNDTATDGYTDVLLAVEVERAPTIEAEPLKHGKWVDRTAWYSNIGRCEYECSSCGYRVMYKPNSRGDGKGGKFCDNCGAKMDLEEKNEP